MTAWCPVRDVGLVHEHDLQPRGKRLAHLVRWGVAHLAHEGLLLQVEQEVPRP